MAVRYYSNNAVATTLTSSIGVGDTSCVVGATTGFPTSYPFTLIFDFEATGAEVVNVTAAAGTTLTITRGQDGTTAVAHSAGAAVVHGGSARDLSEPNAHIAASTDVHGLTGGAAVVGTTQAQTLTNKTIAGGSNTITGLNPQTALSGDFNNIKAITTSAAGIPLIAKGAASQTGNLFEARDSAEVAQTVISSSGRIITGNGVATGGRIAAGNGDVVSGVQLASVVDDSDIGLQINNTGAGTASALEIQDNGTNRIVALKTGQLTQSTGKVAFGAIGTPSGQKVLVVNDGATTDKVLVVKGVASQSAVLQEWQDSAAALKASVDVNGTYNGLSISTASATLDGVSDGVVLTVKGHSTQTSKLTEWKNDASTVVASVDNSGVIKSNVPIAHLGRSSSQSISNAADTAMSWNTESRDTASGHDNATNPSRYTVQVAGTYHVSASLEYDADADGTRDIWFLVNGAGTNWFKNREIPGTATANAWVHTCGTLPNALAVGDYVEVYTRHSAGASINATTNSMFSIHRVGD